MGLHGDIYAFDSNAAVKAGYGHTGPFMARQLGYDQLSDQSAST